MAKRGARSRSSPEPYVPSRGEEAALVPCQLCGEGAPLADVVQAIMQIASGDIAAPVHGCCLHEWYLSKTQLPHILALQTPLI